MDTVSPRNTTESSTSFFIEENRFTRNLWTMSLFSLPIIYLGIILAVSIHEVIGHGLTAALLGGQFKGFGILLDGMGWAEVELVGLSDLSRALMLFGGVFYTTIFSLLFFALSVAFKRNRFIRLTFLFFAITSLLDGLPYFFWDAIYLGGIGDFSMIWFLYHSHILRMVVIVLCGSLMAITIVLFNIHYYKIAYSWLGEGKQIKLKGKILFSCMIFLLQVLGWFSLDWNQLIPGIDSLPNILALAIVLVTLVALVAFYKVEQFDESRQETSSTKTPIYMAWLACMGVIFLILQWLQKGINFS